MMPIFVSKIPSLKETLSINDSVVLVRRLPKTRDHKNKPYQKKTES